ncbi:hypothetical protein OC845_006771 [Tilletia horrida]|nr:hypothetical protein OC845_006771 [Tilletia horrida]
MFTRLSVALLFALASLLIASQPAQALTVGLPWGAAPQLAHRLLGGNSHFKWYMNWGNTRPVSTLSSLQWVPTFWAQSKIGNWHSVERYYRSRGKRPKFILAQNEPDISTQANTSPKAAARHPFLRDLRNMGGKPDFCAAHYYGPANKGLKRFKAYVRRVRSTCRKYGVKKVWLTEIGIMASTHPSQGEVNHFAQSAFRWLETQSYVKRAAWIGVFKVGQPYDGFMSAKNAYFNNDGSVRSLGHLMSHGNIYRRSGAGMERRSVHSAMIERMVDANATLSDLHAALDDPRGQFEEIDESEHDHDDDAYWDAKFDQEDAEDPDHDDDDEGADDDDDSFADGFLHDLPEGDDNEDSEHDS